MAVRLRGASPPLNAPKGRGDDTNGTDNTEIGGFVVDVDVDVQSTSCTQGYRQPFHRWI